MPVDFFPIDIPTVPQRKGTVASFFGRAGGRYLLRPEITKTPPTPGILIWPDDSRLELIP